MEDRIRAEIIRRLNWNANKRDDLLRQLDDLNREDERLKIGLSVRDAVASELGIAEPTLESQGYVPPATKARKKPDGTPTMPEMISAILIEAETEGHVKLESQEIIQRVRAKWWPDAQSNDISPLLWRLSKTGKLIKMGTAYALPSRSEHKAEHG
jgi:hypothetical protein